MDGENQRREKGFLKRFAISIVVAVVLVGRISYAVHMSAVGRRARSIADEDLHNVEMRERSLSRPFREAVSDLLYLSGRAEIVAYLADPTPANRGKLAREFVAFSWRSEVYDQIRLISEDGMELLRVDLKNGGPVSVPDVELQYKGDRYYLKEALACSPGVVYVSPFDLNVEGGEIEYPLQPVVRFVLHVPGSEGKSVGLTGLIAFSGLGFLVLGTGGFFVIRRGIRRTEESDRLSLTLSHFLPDQVSSRLLTDPSRHMGLGGEACHVSVLFADVRGFTGFAEAHDPHTVVEALNRILPHLVEGVSKNGGILDKFLGDGLLAFFEVAESRAGAARRAITAGIEMQGEFARLIVDPEDGSLRGIGLGVGISSGEVIVGNVASRLQGIAKAGEILITEETYELLQGEIEAVRLPKRVLKGRLEEVAIYRVLP